MLVRPCTRAYQPALYDFTGWFRTNYIGWPWVGDASTSTSGSRQLEHATNAPGIATTSLNGYAVPDFDGVDKRLHDQAPIFLDSYLTSGDEWWIGVLCKVDTAPAASGVFYSDPAIVGEQNGGWGIAVNADGVIACNYDGAFTTTAPVAIGTSWAWVEAWRRIGTLYCAVNGGAPATVDAGPLTVPSARQLKVGANYNSSVFFDGQIAEIMIRPTVPGREMRRQLRTNYVRGRYALTLGT